MKYFITKIQISDFCFKDKYNLQNLGGVIDLQFGHLMQKVY